MADKILVVFDSDYVFQLGAAEVSVRAGAALMLSEIDVAFAIGAGAAHLASDAEAAALAADTEPAAPTEPASPTEPAAAK